MSNWKSKFEYVDPRGPAHLKPFPGWMHFTYFVLGWVTFGAFWIIWIIHYVIYKATMRERRQQPHRRQEDNYDEQW